MWCHMLSRIINQKLVTKPLFNTSLLLELRWLVEEKQARLDFYLSPLGSALDSFFIYIVN